MVEMKTYRLVVGTSQYQFEAEDHDKALEVCRNKYFSSAEMRDLKVFINGHWEWII